MANALYGKGRDGFLLGTIAWVAGDIKVTLIDAADYVLGANIDVHQYMNTDTVPAAAKLSTVALTTTAALGVADASDATFSLVTGDPSEALIIWLDGGGGGTTASGTTDLLIAYIDTATGLPVTPNGGDINIVWDNGADKIFKL